MTKYLVITSDKNKKERETFIEMPSGFNVGALWRKMEALSSNSGDALKSIRELKE